MLLVKKCQFFHYLFSLKITLEIGFNNVLQRKELFLRWKEKISQKSHFFKGVHPCFGQKMPNFSLFVFGQNKIRNKV